MSYRLSFGAMKNITPTTKRDPPTRVNRFIRINPLTRSLLSKHKSEMDTTLTEQVSLYALAWQSLTPDERWDVRRRLAEENKSTKNVASAGKG